MEKEKKKNKNNALRGLFWEIALIAAGMAFMLVLSPMPLHYLLDVVTLLLFLMMTLPILLICGSWKDFWGIFSVSGKNHPRTLAQLKRSFAAISLLQRQIIYAAGVIMFMMAVEYFCTNSDFQDIAVLLRTVFLPAFYAFVAELLLLAPSVQVKKRLIDLMEEDT